MSREYAHHNIGGRWCTGAGRNCNIIPNICRYLGIYFIKYASKHPLFKMHLTCSLSYK